MDERAYARYMADVAYFITLLEQNPNSKYFMPIALAYNKMEKYDESISVCKAAITRFPSYCPVKTLLAEAYIYKGDTLTAKNLLFDVITEDPENYKALRLLGTIYKASDETGEALKYFKAAYIRAPEDEELKRMIVDMGASISPDDLFAEFVKKNENANWGHGEDKSYKDIQQHIKSAETIMSDLVSNNDIIDNESSNLISDDEFNKLLSGTGITDENNIIRESEPFNIEQEETVEIVDEKMEMVTQSIEPVVQGQDISDAVDTIIEISEDYSDLTNILEAKPQEGDLSETLSETLNQGSGDTIGEDEVTDVLSALDFNSEAISKDKEILSPFDFGNNGTPKGADVLAALEEASEAVSENENEPDSNTSSSDSVQTEVAEFFVLEEPKSDENEQQGEASGEPSIELSVDYSEEETETTIEKTADTNAETEEKDESDLFVLDEDFLEKNEYAANAQRFSEKETEIEIEIETSSELSFQIIEEDKPSEEIEPFSFLDEDKHIDEADTLNEEEKDVNEDVFTFQKEVASEQVSEITVEGSRLAALKEREASDDSIFSEVASLTFVDDDVKNVQSALNEASKGEHVKDFKEREAADDSILSEAESLTHDDEYPEKNEEHTAVIDVEPLKFELEDIISDDEEATHQQISSQEEPGESLGDFAPFSQKDILDEIYAASNINYGETDDMEKEPVNKEKTKARLLKMQAKFKKLKKG